jgi:hypothetical protein
MPRLSSVEREGKAIVADATKKIYQALDYETSDEDLPEQPEPEQPEPEQSKPKRQRKKVLAVVQPSDEVTEVVLSRPVKRRQVIVYADDEPIEVIRRHRKPGRPATQQKVLVTDEPKRLTAQDVKRRARELEVEELEALSKKKIARRRDGSADGRSLAKRSEAQLESARRLVEANRARRAAKTQETSKGLAKAVIEELASAPPQPRPAQQQPPQPPQQTQQPPQQTPSRFARSRYPG